MSVFPSRFYLENTAKLEKHREPLQTFCSCWQRLDVQELPPPNNEHVRCAYPTTEIDMYTVDAMTMVKYLEWN
uniref:Uncharacterized protein n=1 Tax=Arion vulgaris TaxID=1028688 RepID=A0A0B6ZWZ3_9EUPU